MTTDHRRLAPLVSEPPTETTSALFAAIVRGMVLTETRATGDAEDLTVVEPREGR